MGIMKKSNAIAVSVLIVLVLALLLCACTPGKDAVRKKYELAGFVYDNISANTLGLGSEDVEYVFAAHRDASEDGSVSAAEIEIVLFVDEDRAREYYDAKNSDNAAAIEAGEYAVLMDGAFVLSGSPEAVEVF